jgi:hypothetical protein
VKEEGSISSQCYRNSFTASNPTCYQYKLNRVDYKVVIMIIEETGKRNLELETSPPSPAYIRQPLIKPLKEHSYYLSHLFQ